jgi:hypothetical protein
VAGGRYACRLVCGVATCARDGLPRERNLRPRLGRSLADFFGSKSMFFVEENVHVLSLDFLRSGGVYYGADRRFLRVVRSRGSISSHSEIAGRICTPSLSGQAFGRQGVSLRGVVGENRPIFSGAAFSDAVMTTPVCRLRTGETYLHPTHDDRIVHDARRSSSCSGCIDERNPTQILIAYGIIYSIFDSRSSSCRDDPRGSVRSDIVTGFRRRRSSVSWSQLCRSCF